jgi:hypothetical protein
MTIENLISAIQLDAEYLESTEGDTYGCITLENLEGILTRYFKQTIKLETNGK